jgi:hypothetical protein
MSLLCFLLSRVILDLLSALAEAPTLCCRNNAIELVVTDERDSFQCCVCRDETDLKSSRVRTVLIALEYSL